MGPRSNFDSDPKRFKILSESIGNSHHRGSTDSIAHIFHSMDSSIHADKFDEVSPDKCDGIVFPDKCDDFLPGKFDDSSHVEIDDFRHGGIVGLLHDTDETQSSLYLNPLVVQSLRNLLRLQAQL